MLSVYQISSGSIEITSDISQSLKKAYVLGAANEGGGAIGTLAAIFLVKMLGVLGAIILSGGISIMLFIFICGVDISEFISERFEKHLERKEERKIEKEERKTRRDEYILAQRENIKKQREARRLEQEEKQRNSKQIEEANDVKVPKIEPEQIKINLNGRVIDDDEETNVKGLKKIFGKKNKEQSVAKTASTIMADEEPKQESLFVQEEEKKQDKTKEVLQLGHTIAVEEDNYVFPPVELLSKKEKASLKGKVAGLLVKNSTDFAAAPTLAIRGENPLIVIDGVPYANMTMRDIVADDIESVSVLKGATASALYGNRGASGAVMITTKSGAENKEPISISLASNTMFSAGFLAIPEKQSMYGRGTNNKYDKDAGNSWGAALDGTIREQWDPYLQAYREYEYTAVGKDNFNNSPLNFS